MTIEVFHLEIKPWAQDEPEAAKMHAELCGFGDTAECAKKVFFRPQAWSILGLSYIKMADVQGDDLEAAFSLTNHIESSWTRNPGVKANPDITRFRSTSVGDVMRLNGEVHVVARMGFERISDEDQEQEEPAPVTDRLTG